MIDKETAKKLAEKYSLLKDNEPAPHLLEAQEFWGNDESVQNKIMNDKELYELLCYVALCGGIDSAVFDAAERKDVEFFETLVSNWKQKNLDTSS